VKILTEKVVIKGELVEGYTPQAAPMKFSPKRSNARIVYDFLSACQNFDSYSRIMGFTGLSYKQTKELLKKLKEKDLITIEKTGLNRYSVKLTEKGIRAINLGKEFLTLIGEL
jgi:predicted transcriptional regulator